MIPTLPAIRRNIYRVYNSANDDERALGESWYPDALAFCERLAQTYDLSVPLVASIVAVLSPNCSWATNQADAERVIRLWREGWTLRQIKVSTYRQNLKKALAMLRNDDLEILSGPKVTAFRRCILCADTEAVVVDIHMLCVAVGIEYTTGSQPTITPRQYRVISETLREVAARVSRPVREVQATAWIVRRRRMTGESAQLLLR